MKRRGFLGLLGLPLLVVVRPAWSLGQNLKRLLLLPKRTKLKGYQKAGGTTSAAITLSDARVGDNLLVAVVTYGAATTISSVTCSGESALSGVGSLYRAGGGILSDAAIQLFYLQGVTAGGSKTITATVSAAVNVDVAGYIVLNSSSTAFLDASSPAQAAAGNVNVTVANANSLVVGLCISGGSQSAGPGFNFDAMQNGLQRDGLVTKTDNGPAGVRNVSFSGTGNNIMFAAAFNKA